MYLKSLTIKNFRNIKDIHIDLNKNINIFIGKNAQGKTSILESIYVLSLTKSFKTTENNELINKDSLFSKLSGEFKIGKVGKQLEIVLSKDHKNLKINRVEENRVSNYVSLINIIIFTPDDLEIVKHSPSVRRKMLNIELCQLYSLYLIRLNEYNKILKMRNEYIRNSNIDFHYLDIITDHLIDRAICIMNYRDQFIAQINDKIGDIFYKIMKVSGLRVHYDRSLPSVDKEELKKFYCENLENDCYRKTTMYGPHRDDFSFELNDDNLKLFGSQGQQRVAVLAFKLAEVFIFKEVRNSYPIILFDDIFSELDIEKRKNLLKFIRSDIQFIITTTDLNNISAKIVEKANIYKINNGMCAGGGKNGRKSDKKL